MSLSTKISSFDWERWKGWKFIPNDEWRDEKEGQYPTSGAGYEVSE